MLKASSGRAATAALLLLVSLLALAASAAASVVPSGFRDDLVLTELTEPTALRFAPDGRVFVAEKSGRILVFDDVDDITPTVFVDLRTDVYDPADRGLLGLEIDPQFPARPYVYALYTYDHLLGDPAPAPKWGEPDHSGDVCPKPSEETEVDECPVSGRLVRLSANGDHAVTDGLGKPLQKTLVEDWCQQFSSHSVGDLRFGPGGALYASGGDGASFYDPDYGAFGWPQKNICGDPPGGVGVALMPPSAEGGALRSQDARTHGDPTGLDGTVIRIDPDTGAGLAGNPMAGSADANERRIVAFGFRNPFRFAIDPATGEIYTGNVGWNTYEEIDRFPSVPATAYNSGWPCYEGPGPQPSYQALELNLCKGLYAESGPAEASMPFFLYRHGESVIPEDGCPPTTGSAVSGLTVYRGTQFPDAYDGALFFADPVRGCIYVMPPDDGRPDPLATETFLSEGGLYPGVDLEVGPDGALYYVKLFGSTEGGTIHRISYDPHAPVARLSADKRWGDAPLQVQFDAGGSTDPDGDPLTYHWDLDGDGDFEAAAGPAKRTTTFNGDENVEVSVLVSDDEGKSNVARLTIYPDDTPPEPAIDAPSPQLLWGVGQEIDFAGHADDAEEAGDEVPEDGLYWKLRLYHCPGACHAHPRQVFPATDSGSFIAPDHDYPSHLELSLTATDERGLSTTTAVEIYPRTVDLRIESEPPGLTVGAGLLSQPTPYSMRVIEGSHLLLTAPPSALVGGALVPWTSWSDGGERVHTIVAADSDTYRATYKGTEVVGPKAAAPQTRLRKRPKLRGTATTAKFVFSSNPAGASFQCRLDAAPYKGCRSPRIYRNLKPGKHVFRVRAVEAGATDPTPVVFKWSVTRPR
ncbi:MAG TPA: PQQ-dependent sugar dehydrogenase [Solirubrobacterales bacterium]